MQNVLNQFSNNKLAVISVRFEELPSTRCMSQFTTPQKISLWDEVWRGVGNLTLLTIPKSFVWLQVTLNCIHIINYFRDALYFFLESQLF